jgi:hypothetical protein
MSEKAFTPAEFYQFLGEHKLMGTRCRQCGATFLPPRPLCSHCHTGEMEWVELSGKGKLTGFSIISIAPTLMLAAGYDRKNPYCAGFVQLEEGPSISAQILGVDVCRPEAIAIGTPVTVAYVERGEGEARKTYLAFQVEA